MTAALRISLLGKSEAAAVLLRLADQEAKRAKSAAATRAYRKTHGDAHRAAARKWHAANPDRVAKYNRDRWGQLQAAFDKNPGARADHSAYRKALSKTPNVTRASFEWRMKKDYGISVEEYARLEHSQGRACAGCLESLDGKKSTHLDHNHASGVVRGLLCFSCNLSIGKLKENPTTLRRLADYLEVHAFKGVARV